MNTLQECFEAFKDTVIPNDAGDSHRKDMEMAFYGGALSTFQLMLIFSEYQEDTAACMCDTLNEEIQASVAKFSGP